MIKIRKITVEPTPVYDVTVPETECFFANGILVHNCAEIGIPTKPFSSVEELYKADSDGEIGLCSLAGIIVPNIESDEQYAEVAYYSLKMIDKCIHKSDYTFKSLEKSAKARLSAGVGIIGLAHLMAKKNKKYDDLEGRQFLHELGETHMYHLVRASLRLSKELGVAPWMHKTKWPEGWLPIDTYEKKTDELVGGAPTYHRDWETLRGEIVANGGIRNSVLVAHMPGESCLKFDTKIKTDRGDMDFREIALAGGLNPEEIELDYNPLEGGKWYTLHSPVNVLSTDGYKPVDKLWYNGFVNTLTIEMENGEKVVATHNHKFLVQNLDGSKVWKRAVELREGDDIVEIQNLNN
jgi:hypothetical protein